MTGIRGWTLGYPTRGKVRFDMARDLGRLIVMAVKGILAVLRLEGVDMHRTVRGLSRNVLIHWVPCDTLNVMAVLGDLAHKSA